MLFYMGWYTGIYTIDVITYPFSKPQHWSHTHLFPGVPFTNFNPLTNFNARMDK